LSITDLISVWCSHLKKSIRFVPNEKRLAKIL
jgi:hypothetical protein